MTASPSGKSARRGSRLHRGTRFPRILLLLLLPLSLAASPGTALDARRAWSFEELLAIGLEQNLGLQRSRLDLAGLRWDRLAAYGNLLPSLGLRSSFGYSEDHKFSFRMPDGSVVTSDTLEVVTRSSISGFSLTLEHVLFEGFARTAGLRQALLEEQRLLDGDRLQQLQFRQSLKKAAHRVLAARALLESESVLAGELREQGRLAQARREIGAVTELDVLQTEINLGRQQLNIESARLELTSAWDALALLIGVEPGEPGQLALSFETFQPAWQEAALVEDALEARLDLRDGQRLREQARLGVVRARSTFLPRVSASLSHGRDAYRDGREWDPLPQDYGNSAWLNISLPVFQGFSRVAELQRSQAELRKRDLEREQLERQIRAEVREASQRLQSAWTQSQLAEQTQQLARRSLELERERYRLGLATLLSVQSAEAVWRQAESDLLRQRLAFHDRLADLELAVGHPLQR
jgi:outer membrane protein